VTVGASPRRLALVVEKQPNESFASWVDRLAVRNGCPPWTMAVSLGLDIRAALADVRALAYGAVVTSEMCEATRGATGVAPRACEICTFHLGQNDRAALRPARFGQPI
jgi:hypothetical protein